MMLDVIVHQVRAVARDVISIELRSKTGHPLTGAAPGAHIDLVLSNGMTRQYSLTNALGQPEQGSYGIAVGWDANSRGGSHWIHEKLKVGASIQVSAPRNLFALNEGHQKVLFIAGGIGITPIYAMAQYAAGAGLDWSLVACARSAGRMAYLDEMKALGRERVQTHFDDEKGGAIDLKQLLQNRQWDAVYACGPAAMLDAIEMHTPSWPFGTVRMERFKTAPTASASHRSFELVLSRSAISTQVEAHESALEALERLGVDHPFSCREGLCGTCEVGIIKGTADHRDRVLTSQERADGKRFIPCISRCSGERLVLDI